MRERIGNLCMALGTALVLAALALLLWNRWEARRAGDAAEQLRLGAMEYLAQREAVPSAAPELTPEPGLTPEPEPTPTPLLPETAMTVPTPDPVMPAVEIDGRGCIGCLTIPALDLELPVLAELDAESLKTAPCRYAGAVGTDDLVIGGHNYVQHFGGLSRLVPGDAVYFLDMAGNLTAYAVAAVDVLSDTAVAEMTSGDYALTLFTCTYGGGSRIAVRCDRA